MLRSFSVIILLIFNVVLNGQSKEFTAEDVAIRSYSDLVPSKLEMLQWIPNSDFYSFVSNDELIRARMNMNDERIISLEDFSKKVKNTVGKNIASFPKLKWTDEQNFLFRISNNFYSFNVESKKISVIAELDENAENIELSPNDKYVAYTKDNNLFISMGNDEIKQVTNESKSTIVSGKSVHRNEFGIDKGIFWSPNNNYIAFYKKDESMVTDYPLVNLNETPAEVDLIRYPMSGAISHQVKIGIYSVNTGSTVYLRTGEPKDQYLTSVTWSPDEQFIYVAHLNRAQDYLRLIKYNFRTGDPVKVLFEEENEKYVEPEYPLYFLPKDPNKFLWLSRRDGWKHFYLYTNEGDFVNQVTKGNWEVTSFEGFDAAGENVFFLSTKESPVERQLYKAGIISTNIKKLTDEPGIHKTKVNSMGTHFIDEYSSLDVPRITKLKSSDGNLIKTLHKAENPIKDYALGEVKIFPIKNEHGDSLFCRMIYPVDFDQTKKYPVVFYVYGGPHAQLVLNKWYFGRYDFWFQQMAQNGFIIFTLDNRGSANRGLDFEQETFRQLGTVEIEDQLAGVNYLSGLNFVDEERMGVYGWSYGGFMATSLMSRTDKFDVGVAGGAVIDWNLYEVMYTERYMDTPKENPEGYRKANLLNYVDNLNGKLLMIHGTNDPTVVWQNSLRFVQKAVELNKDLDYFPYIGHGHGVSGNDAVHLYRLITNYFVENLK